MEEHVMDQDLSERIRERAYEIWIAGGYPDGEADRHWLAAEQEILSDMRSAAVAKAPAERSPSAPNAKEKKMYDDLSKLSGRQFDRQFAQDRVKDAVLRNRLGILILLSVVMYLA